MNRTAFACYGEHGKEDSLLYHEVPRRGNGGEFFVFFSSRKGFVTEEMRRLFRITVSLSRLGSGKQYFFNLIEGYKEQLANEEIEHFFEYCTISVMMRRDKELYLFRTDGSDIYYWSKGHGIDISHGLPGHFSNISLLDRTKQGELFEDEIEGQFILSRVELWEGFHTIVIVPSKKFFERYKEGIIDKVFFPDFNESDLATEMSIQAEQSFCGLHWDLGSAIKERKKVQGGGVRKKVSIPVLIGIITAIIAVMIFFGPIGKKDIQKTSLSEKALLVADDGSTAIKFAGRDKNTQKGKTESSVNKKISPEKVDQSIEKNNRTLEVVSLKRVWSQAFKRAVTSTPAYSNEGIVFGCRDGALYSFAENGSMRWRYFSGSGIGATPVCSEGRVVCANYRGRVFAVEEKTGHLIWSYDAGKKVVSSPRIHDDMVILGTMDGRVISLRLKNGQKLWEKHIGSAIWGAIYTGSGYLMAPTTDGSLVKMNYSGGMLWKIKLDRGILSAPICIEHDNLVVFGCQDRYVYGYSLINGAFRWKVLTSGEVNAPPAYCDSLILIGSKDRNLYAIYTNGRVKWKTNLHGSILSKPLGKYGKVFVTTYSSRLYVLDLSNGKMIDSFTASSPIYSSCVEVGNRLFFGSNGGVVYAVNIFRRRN